LSARDSNGISAIGHRPIALSFAFHSQSTYYSLLALHLPLNSH
jgi:hypothetical protein